ncbi:unnamed protein product [Cylindrotheca closterium]|uniref:HSF-type DNA-binding domain-containing protein n=1 Tax=Cylindrotheca closterium TaxID=2856 RepID=A0AAD2FE26_9STRA|nr:unnamed protein product [Cylindrotheca closterium]
MPPSDNTMNPYSQNLEGDNTSRTSSTTRASTSQSFSNSIQPITTTEGEKIPQLSFNGLLQQEADLPSSKLPFVWKLYEMLEGVERSGDEHIVSWVESGRAFRVHRLDEFVKNIVPIYFKQSKYKSFQRQLNFYGFTRIASGPNTGAYYHAQFLKGNKAICLSIRPKAASAKDQQGKKTKASAKTGSNSQEPQWMPQIQSLLAHGADHALKQQQQHSAAKIMPQPPVYQRQLPQHSPRAESTALARMPVARRAPEQEEEQHRHHPSSSRRIRDGDAVTVFGNMSFHYVGKR